MQNQYFNIKAGVSNVTSNDGNQYFNIKKSFRPFIIKVKSGNDGTFTIPTTGGGYLYDIKTSDGQFEYGVGNGNKLITFPDANTEYEIEISGSFPRIYFNNGRQRLKLIDIKQWGDIEWTSMARAFLGCSNMTCSATDTPNLSSVTNMSFMFYSCTSLTTINVSVWGVSGVEYMDQTFNFCYSLESEIDFSESYALRDIRAIIGSTKVPSFKFYGENIDIISRGSFGNVSMLDVLAYELSIPFDITFAPNILGQSLDNLANSVKDMTGQPSPTVTMTTGQYNSCDVSLWTNKNWTIVIV